MKFPVPGDVLRFCRDQADVRQSALAKALEVNAPFVSRLEKSSAVDPAFAERYLRTVDSDLGREVLEFYDRAWVNGDPPSFLHPDRESLWLIEETLQQISTFEKSPQNHPILAKTISILRDDLASVLRYIERLDHVVAWLGDIGVGKTTALAHAARLVTSDGKSNFRPVFPVGSGRVTVCEVIIKNAPAFGVAVEPLSEDAIRSLVRELINGISGEQAAVPAEVARVLRNMSGYRTERVANGDDFETKDPIAQALASGDDKIVLSDKMIAAMDLASRRETSVAMPEDSEDGLQWLARTITRINSGQDSRFSVPRRVTVLVPSVVLKETGDLSIVDTKGIEAVTQRADLRGYIDDPRALVVLCTKFPDAPNATVQRILKENDDSGSDSLERGRAIMLVLPRHDEPLQVLDQGEPPSSRAEGQAIRRDEIRHTLSGAGLPSVPVHFYDAHLDSPESVWIALRNQIGEMRRKYLDRLDRSARAVTDLVSNVDLAKTRGAQSEIEQEFDFIVQQVAKLPDVRRQAHQNLVDQLDLGHQSSVAASMTRRGEWSNFSMSYILGIGVRQDVNLRSRDHLTRIKHAIETMELKYGELPDVRATLQGLHERLAVWRQEFLSQAQSIGNDEFKPVLDDKNAPWADVTNRYGTGVPGYKKDVAKMWSDFFETAVADPARASIEARLDQVWKAMIVEPLTQATRAPNT